jgi:hypothetical protein
VEGSAGGPGGTAMTRTETPAHGRLPQDPTVCLANPPHPTGTFHHQPPTREGHGRY